MDILEDTKGTATQNMAIDSLLLTNYPHSQAPRFRHYSWKYLSGSFGKLQNYQVLKKYSSTQPIIDWVRRPTAGGIVDHTNDWTYSLILPPNHFLAKAPACDSYQAVHQVLQHTFKAFGIETELLLCQRTEKIKAKRANVCFHEAQISDLMLKESIHQKIAGAAQQRTKEGLLFQGSINQAIIATNLKEAFKLKFIDCLSKEIQLGTIQKVQCPQWPYELLKKTINEFASQKWTRKY